MTAVSVDVTVDIDLRDIDTDTLLEECEERGLAVNPDTKDVITEMFFAFQIGAQARAIELARRIAQDVTGRVL